MKPFERIYATVRRIPFGRVASYGQVAQAAGLFRGAQLVGWALKALPAGSDVPWQRVVNQAGRISIRNPEIPPVRQKEALEAEGVRFAVREDCYELVDPPWHTFEEGV